MLINSPNISGSLNVSGNTIITGSLTTSIAALNSAATTFLTSDGGTIKSRTAAQTLSDIGAQASGSYLTISIASGSYVPYTGATCCVNLGYNSLSASNININGTAPTAGSYLGFKHSTTVTTGADGYTSMYTFGTNTIAYKSVNGATTKDFSFSMACITPGISGGRVYTLPDSNGTIALTSNLSSYVTYTGATQDVNLCTFSIAVNSVLANQITVNPSGTNAGQIYLKHGSTFSLPNGFGSIGSSTGNQFRLYQVSSEGVWRGANISLNSITSSATRTYTLPDSDGTLALASSLSGYLPLTGGTLTGDLIGTNSCFSGKVCAPVGIFTNCVGINTTAPDSLLHVLNCSNTPYNDTNTLASGQWFRVSNPSSCTGATTGMVFVVQGPDGGNGLATINGVTTSCGSMAITFATRDASGNVTERMRVASGGNVGIGTITPDSRFEIRGSTASPQFRISRTEQTNQGLTIQAGGGITSFNSYDGTDTVFGGYVFNGTKCNTTVERMRITTDGVTCFACQVRVQGDIVISSASAKFYQLTNNCKSADSVLDIYNTATNGFGVSIQAGANSNNYALAVSNFQSTPLLYVAGNGQVGIGCNTPSAKLTINNGDCIGAIHIYGSNSSYTSQVGFYDSTNVNAGDGVGGQRVALIEIGTVAGSGTGCRGASMGLYTHEANGTLKLPLLLTHTGHVCIQGNLYTTCTLFAPGTPIQIVTGTVTFTSGNSGQVAGLGPATCGTTPIYNHGCVITSVSFTPKSTNSKLLIQTNNVAVWETANVSDHFYIWASNDTAGSVLTKSGAYITNFGACFNHGGIINLNGTANSWGTSTNTVSFRVGTTGGGNFYQYNPFYGASGFNADTVGHFSYTITEIAQ